MSSQRSRTKSSQRSNRDNSQRGEGSQKRRADDLSEEQFEAAVLNVTNFLLCDMRMKRKLTKDEVVVNALKSARQYGAIIKRAKENLYNIFGLKLVKISDNPSDDSFIIINKHRTRFSELTLVDSSTEGEIQDDLILTVSLASIFMNRGQMFKSHLLAILETIGFLSDKFYGSACEHKMKEHVPKLITQVFVKQMYLEAKTVPRPEQVQNPPLPEQDRKVTIFSWGFRAYLEVDADKIVDYLVKIHNGNKPAAFPLSYYRELQRKQGELRARAELS